LQRRGGDNRHEAMVHVAYREAAAAARQQVSAIATAWAISGRDRRPPANAAIATVAFL